MSMGWTCSRCGTVNGPHDGACLSCEAFRPAVVPTVDRTAVMPAVDRSGGAPPRPTMPPGQGTAAATPYGAATGPSHGPHPGYPGAPVAAPAASGSGGGGRTVLIGAIAAVVAVLLGVGAFLIISGGDSDDGSEVRASDGPSERSERSSSRADDPAPVEGQAEVERFDDSEEFNETGEAIEAIESETPAVSEDTGLPTEATFWGTFANLRAGPSLSDEAVHELRTMGQPMTVFEESDPYWYLVEIDGYQGYLYGGFIDMPGDAFCIFYDEHLAPEQSTRLMAMKPSLSGDGTSTLATLPDGSIVNVDLAGKEQVGCW